MTDKSVGILIESGPHFQLSVVFFICDWSGVKHYDAVEFNSVLKSNENQTTTRENCASLFVVFI